MCFKIIDAKKFINLILYLLIICIIPFWGFSQTGKLWDKSKLEKAAKYAKEIGTFAFVIQVDGKIVYSFGDIDRVSRVHSVRKAILMALISQHLDKIDLQSTLAELGIDDEPIPLTKLQKTAKVIHLLKSTSGINHPAVSQVGNAQKQRDYLLGKQSNVPGTKWAYNNWDYNALTTIFEKNTGLTISEAFDQGIANPLNIKDYQSFYRRNKKLSVHAKVGFRLSTRDMAKFGQLFLNKGIWGKKQLIKKTWIENITKDYTIVGTQNRERYAQGYLWWMPSKDYANGLPSGSYMTTGTGGQRILVIPKWNMVIAHKTMTDIPKNQRTPVSGKEFEQFVILVSKALKQ